MAADNWDDLLSDLGSKPKQPTDNSPAEPKEAEPKEPVTEAKAEELVADEMELPEEYPTSKPSAWDTLAVSLGAADEAPSAPAPKSPAPKPPAEAAKPKPKAVEKPVAKKLAEPVPEVREEPVVEIVEAVAEAVVESEAAAEPKARGFTGWFPFAGRRAKPEADTAAEPAPAVSADAPSDELPSDLFGAADDLEPAADPAEDDSAEGTAERGNDGESGEERPKRRRRRGGRRRRKKPVDSEASTE